MLGDFNPYRSFAGDEILNDELAVQSQTTSGAQGAQGPSGRSATKPSGGLAVTALADSEAETNTIYYSLTRQILVFKDTEQRIFAITNRQPLN